MSAPERKPWYANMPFAGHRLAYTVLKLIVIAAAVLVALNWMEVL